VGYQKLYEINPFEDVQEEDDRFELVINPTDDTKLHKILIDELGNEKFYTIKLNFVESEVITPIESEVITFGEDNNWINYFFGSPSKIMYTVTGAMTAIFISYRVISVGFKVVNSLDLTSAAQDIKDQLYLVEKCQSDLSNVKTFNKNYTKKMVKVIQSYKEYLEKIMKEEADLSKILPGTEKSFVISTQKKMMKEEIDLSKILPGAEKSFVISTQKKILEWIENHIQFKNKQYVGTNKNFEDSVKNLLDEVQVEMFYVVGGVFGLAASTVAYKLLGELAELE
jgi:hypothetical protein